MVLVSMIFQMLQRSPEFIQEYHFLTLQFVVAWPSYQHVGLAIRRSRVQVQLLPLAGFVLDRSEFISLATLVNR